MKRKYLIVTATAIAMGLGLVGNTIEANAQTFFIHHHGDGVTTQYENDQDINTRVILEFINNTVGNALRSQDIDSARQDLACLENVISNFIVNLDTHERLMVQSALDNTLRMANRELDEREREVMLNEETK